MADQKISQLTTLAQADVDVAADWLAVVDTGATETKKVSPQALVQAAAAAPGSTVIGQTDVGTAPNQIPLNQYLGSMAYQNTESVVVDNLTVSTGNVVIGTAGKGIDFSSDSSAAGMTSELLDDYEEGTWTPVIAFGGASVGITYGERSSTYTKIGRFVYASCIIELTNKGSSTGNVQITGLPFTNASGFGRAGSIASVEAITFSGLLSVLVTSGGTAIGIWETTDAGVRSNITNSDFANNSLLYVSVMYEV